MEEQIILKVLVGSRAHNLAGKDSDYDYRAVYVTPTSEILSLNHKYKANCWIEGKEDNTSYELGHFLNLAIHCNPSILEVFKAPVYGGNKDGLELRQLFDYIWNAEQCFNAFAGYGFNSQRGSSSNYDGRWLCKASAN